jgi:GxxExxY protein
MENMERDSQTYAIIGAAMEVHQILGPGFLEAVYQAALAIEVAEKGIPFQKEVSIRMNYKGKELNCTYRADYIC